MSCCQDKDVVGVALWPCPLGEAAMAEVWCQKGITAGSD